MVLRAMSLLILFLIVGILPDVEGKHCHNPPPGISKIIQGVDVTALDLLPLDLSSHSKDGFRQPVTDFTCDLKRTWTNRKKERYELPDQVWHILNVPGGSSRTQTKIFKSTDEVKKSLAVSVGLGVNFLMGSFSASVSYENMKHTLTKTSRYIEEVSSYDAAMKVRLQPHFALSRSRNFKYVVDKLPAKFTTNPEAYFKFIHSFGTHYFTTGNFGGMIRLHMKTQSNYFEDKTDKRISVEVKASFLDLIKADIGVSSSHNRRKSKLEKSSDTEIRYYGGDVNILQNGMKAWQPTVIRNPWLVTGELANITDLINDTQKQNSMKRAVNAYLNKAYFRELERVLTGSGPLPVPMKEARFFLSQVQTELKKVEPNQTVADLITPELLVPSWFANDVQLCFKWDEDGQIYQCGLNGIAKTLCAKPGRMTTYYTDDSDSRPGGCLMRWGLIPKRITQPHWFNSVRICFKSSITYAPFNSSALIDTTRCSSFGQYTSTYRDDTSKSTRASMSWKLEVPSSSPMWLKNARLCFQWNADVDAGQCQGGKEKELCAKANSWTKIYNDHSDYRYGGCGMMWGIKFG